MIVSIAFPSGGVFQGSGTSFSSPIIAGMTACLWQANPDFNNMEIMQAIQQSANRYDNPNDSLSTSIKIGFALQYEIALAVAINVSD